jgi:hypothetical protein
MDDIRKKPGRAPKPQDPELTLGQFDAFAKVARLRKGPSTDLLSDVLVFGLPMSVAAAKHGMHQANASSATARARSTLHLIRVVAGTEVD